MFVTGARLRRNDFLPIPLIEESNIGEYYIKWLSITNDFTLGAQLVDIHIKLNNALILIRTNTLFNL